MGWEYTVPDLLDSAFWDAYFDAVVADRYNLGIGAAYSRNPYAAMDILAHFAEMANRGQWDASPQKLAYIAEALGSYVAEHGVSCSGSICGDRELMKWLSQYMSADVKGKFTSALYAATGAAIFAPEPASDPGENPVTGPVTGPVNPSPGGSSGGRTGSSAGASEGGTGPQKSYEVKETPETLNEKQDFPVYGVIGIVALLALVGVGYFLGPGRR